MKVGKGHLVVISNIEDATIEKQPIACAGPYIRFMEVLRKTLEGSGLSTALAIQKGTDGLPLASAYLWQDDNGERWITIGARMTDASVMPPLINGQVLVSGSFAKQIVGSKNDKSGNVIIEVPGTYLLDE